MSFVLRYSIGCTALVLASALGLGCSYSHGDPQAAVPCNNASAALATYHGVVSPIFDQHCRECHSAANANALGGGNNFGDYQNLVNYSGGSDYLLKCIKQEPGADPMPKFPRAKLSDCDIARIEAWIEAGQPNN